MKSMHLVLASLLFSALVTASAQTGTYRFALNQPYKYIIEGKNEVLTEAMGQTYNATTDMTGSVIMTADKLLENGNTHCNILFEKILILIDSPQGSQSLGEEMSGKTFGVTIDQYGDIVGRDSSIKDLPQEGMQFAGQIFRMFPTLKPENLKPGSEWDEDRIDTVGTGNNTILSKSKMNYQAKGEETVKGKSCLAIATDGTVDVEGTGARGGMEFHINGHTAIKGTIHFDVSGGQLVQLVTESTGEQELRDPGNTSMVINMTITGSQKVELVTE